MKKGFTLIELLAVIVILAIIALIATPIILNIINDSKKEATLRSSDNYIDAVNLAIARKNLNSEFNPDVCEIQSNGDLLCNAKKLNIEVDGEKPSEGWILISDGKVEQYSIKMSDSVVSKDETGKETIGSEIKEQPGSEDETNHLAKENVSAVENPTINGAAVGITPELDTNGNIKPGSTFNIKVNEQDTDGSIFYVLSNEGDYVNLIAQQNITPTGEFTSELQDNDEWYVTTKDNGYGPQTAYTYLSGATSNWTNIPIIESFSYLDEGNQSNSSYGYQGITTTLDSESGNYITTITPLSASYGDPVTYTNMRARLPYESEITTNTSCKLYSSSSDSGSCPLWMVNYLYSNSTSEKYYTSTMGKVNSTGGNYGYWILSSYSGNSNFARFVFYFGYVHSGNTNVTNRGLRPVITILKSDLLRVM